MTFKIPIIRGISRRKPKVGVLIEREGVQHKIVAACADRIQSHAFRQTSFAELSETANRLRFSVAKQNGNGLNVSYPPIPPANSLAGI